MAKANAAQLAPVEAQLTSVREELRRLATRESPSGTGYSRFEIERALRLYMGDGDALSSDPHPLDVRDIHGRYPDDDEPEGAKLPKLSWSLHVSSRPRSRNVFGERMSWPGRGRKNRGPLPRGAGPQPARIVRRVDLQRAMRAVSVRSAEVAFMRGVLDWRFSEIAAHYAYSEQAAQKAYGKALKDLQTALNGATSETTDAELLAREADLERLVAGRRYWLRQAMQLDARLDPTHGTSGCARS